MSYVRAMATRVRICVQSMTNGKNQSANDEDDDDEKDDDDDDVKRRRRKKGKRRRKEEVIIIQDCEYKHACGSLLINDASRPGTQPLNILHNAAHKNHLGRITLMRCVWRATGSSRLSKSTHSRTVGSPFSQRILIIRSISHLHNRPDRQTMHDRHLHMLIRIRCLEWSLVRHTNIFLRTIDAGIARERERDVTLLVSVLACCLSPVASHSCYRLIDVTAYIAMPENENIRERARKIERE